MSKYIDSTPQLHVGSSSFEDWYQAHEKACTGDKQLARDAYAAGMGDPLVTYAQTATQAMEALKKIALTQYHIERPPLYSLDEQMRQIARAAIAKIGGAL